MCTKDLWSRGHKAQRHKKNPRPRTDPLEAKDTGASVLKKIIKKTSGDLQKRKTKKDLRNFSARVLVFSCKILTVQKIVLYSSLGQGNFRGLEASRPRTSKCVLEAKNVLENSTSGAIVFVLCNNDKQRCGKFKERLDETNSLF